MNFCSDIIGEIVKYLNDYMPSALISSTWRESVQEKIEREFTLWQILFPRAVAPLTSDPMPDILLGDLQDVGTRQFFIIRLEKWLTRLGDKKRGADGVDCNIPLISKKWDSKCQQDKIFIFTAEWQTYFRSVRTRAYAALPLYYFVGGAKKQPNTVLISGGENLLLNLRFEDTKNIRLMKKLSARDWICWRPLIDDGEIDGYEFEEQTWRDLEKISSYITGLPVRDPPDFPSYIPGHEETTADDSELKILRNIRRHR